jgi:hypothetical protein
MPLYEAWFSFFSLIEMSEYEEKSHLFSLWEPYLQTLPVQDLYRRQWFLH